MVIVRERLERGEEIRKVNCLWTTSIGGSEAEYTHADRNVLVGAMCIRHGSSSGSALHAPATNDHSKQLRISGIDKA